MANERIPDDLRNLWQGQPLENLAVALEDIRARASHFERRIGRRNLREGVAGAIAMAVYTFYIWKFTSILARVGSAMVIAGVLVVMWRIYHEGRASRLPQELGLSASLEFHRQQLVQQRNLLRTVLRWYLAPLIPGLVVFSAGILPPFRLAPCLLIFTGLFGWIWWVNQRAAERLERQIAELDRLENQP
jgi:hypothetical protein